MLYQLDNAKVNLQGEHHFIAPNASVIGNVTLHNNTSVWFNAVIRADVDTVTIRANSNIQDGAILHVDPGMPIVIGEGVTVGHKVMLHGCTIGNNTLIGINAVVLNGAVIGDNCIIGANALVTEGMHIPDNSLVMGMPAKIKRELNGDEVMMLTLGADHYVQNAQRFHQYLDEQIEN